MTLIDAVISGNVSNNGGGGLIITNVEVNGNPSAILTNVTITGNTETNYNGGGIAIIAANPILTNVTISNNTAGQNGGGIRCHQNASPTLNNVTISNNTADYGGGIWIGNNTSNPPVGPALLNTILWNNSPQEIYFSNADNSNSITISYSDIQGGQDSIVTNDNGTVTWGSGNIDLDPRFVDEENDNYHLLASSMLINAGHPDSTDSDGSRTDMGAYPYLNSYSGPTWYVETEGNDTTGTGASDNPFASIQSGINFSSDADSVTVAAGTYVENINFRGRNIKVARTALPPMIMGLLPGVMAT